MAFTRLTTTQTQFLEKHLRGTGRSLSAAQAKAVFGIQNLSARMSELRAAGLQVYTSVNTIGKTVYMVSRRDIFGGRDRKFK